MNGIRCARTACLLRSMQAQRRAVPLVVPKRTAWPYSAKEGVPREFITILTQDYDLSKAGIQAYMEKSRWKAVKEDHKFVPERHRTLGPDLATAHFLVKRGAKVKFFGRDTWFKKDKEGNMYLPNQNIPGFHLEAIDATGMQWSYVAFDNMIQLEHLRYLKFNKCFNFDNWSMAKMYLFRDSLEFLDISDCWEVTEHGLACLHHLTKLKGLKLSGLPNVKNMGLMVCLLEEVLPECTIFGIEEDQLQLPSDDSNDDLTDRMKSVMQTQDMDSNQSEPYEIVHRLKSTPKS